MEVAMTNEEKFAALRPDVDPPIRKALLDLPDDEIDEETVRAKYQFLVPVLADAFGVGKGILLNESEKAEYAEELIQAYLHELSVNKPSGFAYKSKECVPWVKDILDEGWYFWDRYERYLVDEKGWERRVVKSMSDDTLNILDLMADPRPNSTPPGVDRRGLVVADVQSGKTSNYIGLMARAADAGYRVIIVLAGIYNVLRNQTQVRIEEGFVGFNSNDNSPVGVGQISTEKRWRYGSTRTQDFGKKWLQPLMGTGGDNDKWVFVIKKNKAVLESLIQWLKTHPEIQGPLLLIDDEADNASINVKYAKDDVSVINSLIRRLLKHFKKSSYVGYTATPFANILIDPEAETDKEGEDIFPRSFIYTLEPSTAYFGSEKVFSGVGDDEGSPKHIRFIEDIGDILPSSHKKDIEIAYLPESLTEAIRVFLLASTVKRLRDGKDSHTTMMINVSPYKRVQNQVTDLVKDYVRSIRVAVRSYALLPDALKNQHIHDLNSTWNREFSQADCSWDQVRATLYDVIKEIRTVMINSASNDALNYEKPNIEHAIAVGGYRLSRGLTLEGLLVSYYSRNSRAYDTLMQMARWFGYRPGYEDLCRVWMSREAADWYSFVAEASAELIEQLRTMRQLNSDPSEYGLMVRQSPKALMITARNKMGVGKVEKHPLNLNGSFIETTALLRDEQKEGANREAARKLIDALANANLPALDGAGKSVGFSGVDPQSVKDFIEAYEGPELIVGQPQKLSVLASIDKLTNYLQNPQWDVVFVNGSESSLREAIGLRSISCEHRTPSAGTDSYAVRLNKSRLSSRDVEAFGIEPSVREEIDKKYFNTHGTKNTPGIKYREVRERPLLAVHFVSLRFKDPEVLKALAKEGKISGWGPKDSVQAVGWSISYPLIQDKHLLEFDYVLNGPAIVAIDGADLDEDDPDVP